MPVRPVIVLTRHAIRRALERQLDLGWIAHVANSPDWEEHDPQTGVTRCYGMIADAGGRVLRVAVIVEDGGAKRVLSAHFDRNAARRKS